MDDAVHIGRTVQVFQGFLMRPPRGRMATAIAYRHFGLTVANNPINPNPAIGELPLEGDR